MQLSKSNKLALCAFTTAMLSFSANAAQWDVTITNLTHGNHFTPLLIAAHTSSMHLYEVGSAASAATRLMAECGDISGLVTALGSSATVIEDPASGPLAPGSSTPAMSAMLTPAMGNTNLSIAAMVLPTNDAFIGMDSMQIPTTAGTYTYYLNAYDAGTEANDELLATSACAPGVPGYPAAPGEDTGTSGTGVSMADTNTMIHVHRGVLGDTNPSGGMSDLDSTIHRWQNPVALVTVTVTP